MIAVLILVAAAAAAGIAVGFLYLVLRAIFGSEILP